MRLLTLVFLAACHQDVPTQAVLTPQTTATASATSSATVTTAPTSVAPESIIVTVITPGVLEIENTSDAPVRLATEAHIERENGTPLVLDLGKGYRLVEACSAQPDTCIEIPAHATLRPVPWSGFDCSAQCNGVCHANVWEGGAFRFVVKSCNYARTITTPLFTMPSGSGSHAFARHAFTSSVASATVARLELPNQQFALGAPATPDHIAGFKVKPGTEHPIDKTLADALVALVQNDKGFDDEIAKRCLMTDLVGVRLVRHPPTTGPMKEDVVEIAFDQTCSKFFAVRGDAAHRVEIATHYDPERPAFLAWAKSALTSP